LAVLGDRIVAVGLNADIDGWRGPKTHVIDARGKLLLPGFNDATHGALWASAIFGLLTSVSWVGH
jgi:predicted amidohydrolase YtcJ